MYCCAHKTDTLTQIQHTVPSLIGIGLPYLPKIGGTSSHVPTSSASPELVWLRWRPSLQVEAVTSEATFFRPSGISKISIGT